VHAVPVTAGPELTYEWLDSATNESNSSRDVRVGLSYPESPQVAQPSLPAEIELDRAGTSTTADRFTFRSAASLKGASEFTLHGIVRGRSVNVSLDTSDPPTVHEVNLTAEVLNTSDRDTRLRVSARPIAGGPIERGRILVATDKAGVGRQLTPADNGTVLVELQQSELRSARLRYEPAASWWNQSREYPVVATNSSLTHTVELPPIHRLIEFIVLTALVFLPLYLLLYGFDMLANGKLIGWYEP